MRFLIQKGDKNAATAALTLLLFLKHKITPSSMLSSVFQCISNIFLSVSDDFYAFSMRFRYISTYFTSYGQTLPCMYYLDYSYIFACFTAYYAYFWRFYPVFWLKIAFFSLIFDFHAHFVCLMWFLNAARLSMRLTPVLFHVKLFIIHTNNTLLHEWWRVLPFSQFSSVFFSLLYHLFFIQI